MFQTNLLVRKVISVGLCAAIGFTTLGMGQAAKADAAVVSSADKIIGTGNNFLGVKYLFGAPSGVTYAFDCSSFTQYIFKKNGVSLPRTSTQQSVKGVLVAKSQIKKGDLLFFKDPGRPGKIGHVGVYAGSGKILHTYGKGGVKYSNLNTSYWQKNYVMARRVVKS
ncbi:MAG TPA: C40 family peptidase [Paenibacillus sp.]|uniref:C40 family peptidase n=1 Tax=Paenibacillus sp. TaxID=58172 RepID=UPI0028D1CDC6|nr:C40 family peptidase [Paenibacillus sp.]HUC91788.1 C40 family peptidase [Paenibacillus sp.]